MDNSSKFWVIIVVVIIAAAAGGYWYWSRSDQASSPSEEAFEILSETPQVQIETNPIKKVPDLNPVEKTNPYKVPNPFE